VIVIHEIPGVTPAVVAFADDCVAAGFTVVMPSLVGEPGKPPTARYIASSMLKICVAREFTTWATRRTSPIIAWLNALARELHEECGGPGVGVVGMCFSGGFALAMMVDPVVVAPVMSQPSLPFAVGSRRSADLGLSDDDLSQVRQRIESGCEVMALRFDGDPAVGTRFETLRRELGDAVMAVELPSRARRDHSVLTEQRDDSAVEQVVDFLARKLGLPDLSAPGS
jgi:dienelactone hydrolase